MKFSWPLFWMISVALILAKLIVVPIAGYFVFEQAMGAGWGGASVDSMASKLPGFILFLFCPVFFVAIILFKGNPALLIPVAVIGEMVTTLILGAVITRLYILFAQIPRISKKADHPEIPIEKY